jgi:hypothetical protein
MNLNGIGMCSFYSSPWTRFPLAFLVLADTAAALGRLELAYAASWELCAASIHKVIHRIPDVKSFLPYLKRHSAVRQDRSDARNKHGVHDPLSMYALKKEHESD